MADKVASKKILLIVFITIFLDMLGMGIIIPVIPSLFAPNSGYEFSHHFLTFSNNYALVGWLTAIYPLMQFVFTPLLGQAADRYGRRKVLIYSVCGTFISYLLFAYAVVLHSLELMFIARLIDGLSGANIAIAQTIISDVSEEKNLARNFGLIGAAIGLGFVLGPFLGGVLADGHLSAYFSPVLPFLLTASLSMANLILLIFVLPETLSEVKTGKIILVQPVVNLMSIVKLKQVNKLILIIFTLNAGFACFTAFWGILLAAKLHFTSFAIGKFFGYLGIMIIFAQGVVVRRLSGKVSAVKILQISLFGVGCVLVGFYFGVSNTSILLINFLVPVLALFMALSKAFSMSLLSQNTPSGMRGTVMGISSSSNALAQAMPVLVAGYFASHYSTLPILLGAAIIFIGWGYFLVQSPTQLLNYNHKKNV